MQSFILRSGQDIPKETALNVIVNCIRPCYLENVSLRSFPDIPTLLDELVVLETERYRVQKRIRGINNELKKSARTKNIIPQYHLCHQTIA